MQSATARNDIYQRPAELLQHLIRFDTSNPGGHEEACVTYVRGLLEEAGIPCTVLEKSPGRPNLIARLKGQGSAPPLLLQGHVDVVPTTNQHWGVPPFEGLVKDGYVWGRGALDMKGGVAMMLAAFLRARAEAASLPGDVMLCILSDEEAGSDLGAKFLVEEHPNLFAGVRYALGEFGGFSMQLGRQRFYPIQVAEKQVCWMKLTVRGPGGHGSMPLQGGAMAKMGAILQRLDNQPFPIHITPAFRLMAEGMAAALPFPAGFLLRQLLTPALTDPVLRIFGQQGSLFRPLVRNTVSPTIVRGGDKINVHPAAVSVELDCRLLPGFTSEQMMAELRPVVGPDAELELLRHDRGLPEPSMGLFDVLAGVLKEADPTGIPGPLLLPAVTDGRFFAQLGIQTYGFTPMILPPGLNFQALIHSADERIPAEAVAFGADAIYRVLQRFGQAR